MFKMKSLKKNAEYYFWLCTLIIIFFKSMLFLNVVNIEGNSRTSVLKGVGSIASIGMHSNFISSFEIFISFILSIGVYLAFITVFLAFAFLYKRNAHTWFLIIFNILVSLFLLADMWNYRAFGTFLSAHALKEVTNLDNLSSSVLSMSRLVDVLFFVDIPLLIYYAIKKRAIYKNISRSIVSFLIIFTLSVGYISLAHYRIDILKKDVLSKQLFYTCWTPAQTMSNLSPIGYKIYDLYTFYKDCQPLVLSQKEKSDIDTWFQNKKEDLPSNKYSGSLKGSNLLIIQVESLEGFVINRSVNNQEITPNLNKLLKNSLYFSNYHEQVYNGTSADSDLMANTSVYPIRRGVTFFRYPHTTFNSLPKIFEKEGYSSIAIHPDKASYYNWKDALTFMGYDKLLDESNYKHDEMIGLGISDGSFFNQIEPIIKEQKQPFSAFTVTLTSHGPFDLPEKYKELKIDPELDKTKMGGYFQSVHYTDKQIGIFLDKLDKDGILDNTTVVIYGDHCGIHKFYQEEVDALKSPEEWWLDNKHHIPLIVYNKKQAGEEIKTIGGQVDLLPTLSYLWGIDKKEYEDTTMGRNLLNTKKNFVVLCNKEYVGDYKNEEEKQEAIKGIDYADDIIRSDYFKEKLSH